MDTNYLKYPSSKERCMKILLALILVSFTLHVGVTSLSATEVTISDATQECLDCHASFHPGIVKSWEQSRHAATTPQAAMEVNGLARKVSAASVPEGLKDVAVGCAECHLARPEAHEDTFEHNGYGVHVVVSPDDCKTCHSIEVDQYTRNIMSYAVKNLSDNAIYKQLQHSILGIPKATEGKVALSPANGETRAEACYYCHGTRLKVTGTVMRNTDAGELTFPVIQGWPNNGVGRINLDGSRGSCAACHSRHTFSLEMARKPHTCRECHIGPDVPAYKVYASSKHGNIYATQKGAWDFSAVPWTMGRDFTAPTCAACHISLLQDTDEEVVAERSHEMKDRLAWRIFGLFYAHPQPISPDTSIIRNSKNQPLPTDLDGNLAPDYLISSNEQAKRISQMQAICLKCHAASWVDGHFKRYRNTIQASNQAVKTATTLMQWAWSQGLARGLDQKENPFDEALERLWCDTWLFYANTVRFTSAMAGGGDYGVFADGRYQLSSSVFELEHRIYQRRATAK
jgi:hypothetical protein